VQAYYFCSILEDIEEKIVLSGSDGKIIINNPWVMSNDTSFQLIDTNDKKIEEIFYNNILRHKYLLDDFNHSSFLSKQKKEKKLKENLFLLKRNTEVIQLWRDY